MFNNNIQEEIPVSYCESCHGEIYNGDLVYDLAQVYMNGRCIIHEDCLLESLDENRELVTQFIFSDFCLLQDIFNDILYKFFAWDIYDEWSDNADE